MGPASRPSVARYVAAAGLALHGAAHLAFYPVSGRPESRHEPSFWNPPALERDAAGLTARALLVLATVGFLWAAWRLARSPSPRRRWIAVAAVACVFSVSAVALLWRDMTPRPSGLWVGAAISGAVLIGTSAWLGSARRSRLRRR